MPRDWEAFWRTAATRETDLRKQVGRTVAGQPTPDEELEILLVHLRTHAGGGARHLDLCCGNGYLTARMGLAPVVYGLDYSPTLIEVARREFPALVFLLGSIKALPEDLSKDGLFDRVTMMESLQYFEPAEVVTWLAALARHCSNDVVVLFQGVPDAALYDKFADTPERKADMARRRATDGDPIGIWWEREQMDKVAEVVGMQVEFIAPAPELNTAHYRFDARLTRR